MFDLVSFIPRAVMQGIPLLYGSTGEILTEKSGNLNLGIPGVMYVGGICGVIGAFFYEQAVPVEQMNAFLAIGIPMLSSLLGSLLMGLIYSVLTITLRANQNGGSLIKLTGSEVPSIALSATSGYFSRALPFADKAGWFGKVFLDMTARIENPNGPSDWIACNPDIVADHAGDMFNGFDVTLELVWDLVELYGFIERREWAEMVPSSLPVYLISGDCDPCGNYGEGLYHVANLLAESGNKVSVKAYSGYRHEIHNELELRDEVEAGLVGFVNGVLG